MADIPVGEVMTYGEVAEEAGFPGAARAVGTTMRDHGEGVAWWRVVRSNGELASSHLTEQAERLRQEGVTVIDQVVSRFRR